LNRAGGAESAGCDGWDFSVGGTSESQAATRTATERLNKNKDLAINVFINDLPLDQRVSMIITEK
jgi:hypothetical protein